MERLAKLAARYGAPLYLYDEEVIAGQLESLRDALPDFGLLYSLKANPHPAVLRFMRSRGTGADAASGAEVRRALEAGFAPRDIFYSAPAKSEADLRASLGQAVIIADSYGELERLNFLAREAGLRLEVGLRVNPDLSFGPGVMPEVLPGASNKFGVDEESLSGRRSFFRSLTHLSFTGVHCYLRCQVLSHAALYQYCRRVFSVARLARDIWGEPMSFVNFGGGFGIACGEWEKPLDLEALGEGLAALVREQRSALPEGVRLCVESGRFLVARAGSFVARVEDVKESRGTTYVLAPGALNGFLRPALMNVFASLSVPGPLEPLYGNSSAHRVSLPGAAGRPLKKVTVCGNLCTGYDIYCKDTLLPEPRVGDLIVLDNAGAYSASLSPFAFAGFERPPELYRDASGEIFTE